MVRIALFLSGFALWAVCSYLGAGVHGLREAWDGPGYWMFGTPLLLLIQLVATPWLREPPMRQPLWAIAGHVAAMIIVHPAGSDLGLLPIAMLFIGLPAYGALYLAGMLGRTLLASDARDA